MRHNPGPAAVEQICYSVVHSVVGEVFFVGSSPFHSCIRLCPKYRGWRGALCAGFGDRRGKQISCSSRGLCSCVRQQHSGSIAYSCDQVYNNMFIQYNGLCWQGHFQRCFLSVKLAMCLQRGWWRYAVRNKGIHVDKNQKCRYSVLLNSGPFQAMFSPEHTDYCDHMKSCLGWVESLHNELHNGLHNGLHVTHIYLCVLTGWQRRHLAHICTNY